MNKGDLPLMYSCVFWCEFIAVYSVFWLLLFHPCHSVHNTKWRQHRKTAGGPDLVYLKAVCGLKTHRIADFFDQRQTSIIAAPQLTFKSEISPCMLLEMNISSSHVQCRDTAPGHGALAPRSNFPRPRVAQSTKKTPQQTFPVVIQILSILKSFVYCCHSDIHFTKNCILTNFIS